MPYRRNMTADYGNYPLPSYDRVNTSNKYLGTRDTPNSEEQIPDCKDYKSAYPISLAM